MSISRDILQSSTYVWHEFLANQLCSQGKCLWTTSNRNRLLRHLSGNLKRDLILYSYLIKINITYLRSRENLLVKFQMKTVIVTTKGGFVHNNVHVKFRDCSCSSQPPVNRNKKLNAELFIKKMKTFTKLDIQVKIRSKQPAFPCIVKY